MIPQETKPIGTDRKPIGTDRDEIVISCLAEKGSAGVSEVAELLNLGKDRTKAILRDMVRRGIIEKVGDKRYTRYTLPKHGESSDGKD